MKEDNKMKDSKKKNEVGGLEDLEFINLDEEEDRKKPKGLDTDVAVMAFAIIMCAVVLIAIIIIVFRPREKDVVQIKTEDPIMIEEVEVSIPTTQSYPPYYIDDIDFSKYNQNEESIESIMEKLNNSYYELKVFSSTFYGKADAILDDGNYYRMHQENGCYQFYLIAPYGKTIKEVISYSDNIYLNEYEGLFCFTFLHGENYEGENLEVYVSVEYTDGSTEEVTLYITKMYS